MNVQKSRIFRIIAELQLPASIEAAKYSYLSPVLTCMPDDVSCPELITPTLDFIQRRRIGFGQSRQRCQPGTNGYTVPSLTINPLLLKGETYGSTGYTL